MNATDAGTNADLPIATLIIILALAYFLTSLGFTITAALRSSRRPARPHREPTSLCPRCRSITWTGGLCWRCGGKP